MSNYSIPKILDGDGGLMDFGARFYDPRLGRFSGAVNTKRPMRRRLPCVR